VVETADRTLHLQTLMADPLRSALADAPAHRGSLLYRLSDALAKTRRSVEAHRTAWRACQNPPQRKAEMIRLFAMLRQLAASCEQKGRQAHRRTPHAQQRQAERRPVHKAADDVAMATAADFFMDTVRHSLIVVGRSGRCHVFSEDGRHITTLTLAGDKFERRTRTRRYVPLSLDQYAAFRPQILARAHG
jgi:hypothetical protein